MLHSDATALYRSTVNPDVRRQMRAAVVEEYRDSVRAVVRGVVPRQHWDEAEQAGIVGLLLALQAFEPPADVRTTISVCFWTFAKSSVRKEIQRWLDAGVFWRPASHEKDGNDEARRAQRRVDEFDEEAQSGIFEIAESVERLVSEHQLHKRLRDFLATLSDKEQNLLLTERRNRFSSLDSSGYLSLVERARNYVLGKDADGHGGLSGNGVLSDRPERRTEPRPTRRSSSPG